MMKRKVCVVVASRANYGRIKSAMTAIAEQNNLELQVVVSASALLDRFGRAIDVIQKDGFEVSAKVYVVLEGETPTTMAKTTGLAIIELATILENLKPDVVVSVADRFETLATAVAASYMNIPVAHTQGGETSGSIDQSVRHAITKLSHLHFPATDLAKQKLIELGEEESRIVVVGCPAIDLLLDLPPLTQEIFGRTKGAGQVPDLSKPYILVVQHPVTTEYSMARRQIEETLRAVSTLGMQTIWLWPNVDAGSEDLSRGIRVYREQGKKDHIGFYKNFSPGDYATLLKNAECIVGNSSSGIREAEFLGTPCVNIGTRQSGRERGENVVDVEHDKSQIESAIKKAVDHGRFSSQLLYGDGTAGVKIADYLANCHFRIQK
jgi:UDP-hydrolysing UDP-N-acetyl-D-glucosamine 2-epimerase